MTPSNTVHVTWSAPLDYTRTRSESSAYIYQYSDSALNDDTEAAA